MIHAVIFNLDGVLVSTDQCHYQAWRELAHEQGVPFSQAIYGRIAGMKRMDSLKLLLKKAERKYSPAEYWALSARKNDIFNDLIVRLGREAILPGAEETLKALREMGVKTGVASSSENARGILRQLKLDALIDATVDGGEVKSGKPDPEVLLLTARKLSVPTNECLVIDNTKAGEEAARNAGMRCLTVQSAVLDQGDSGAPRDLMELNLPALLRQRQEL